MKAIREILVALLAVELGLCSSLPAQAPVPPGGYAPYNNMSAAPTGMRMTPVGQPQAPITGSRPDSWPGGPGERPREERLPPGANTVLDPFIAALPPVTTPSGRVVDSTTILVRCGSEVVQAVDVLPTIDDTLSRMVGKAPTPPPQEELAKARTQFVRQSLPDAIKVKLLLGEAKRNIPAENLPKIEESMSKAFNSQNIPQLMKTFKVENRADLEAKLRSYGSSLENQKRLFIERMIAFSWLQQQVKSDTEITHEDMLEYYQKHLADYEEPAKARWEHLAIRFEKHASKDEMVQMLCDYGNQVLSGAPFAEVAKAHSEDFSAPDGGMNPWTTKGSLASPVIDNALFTLPAGKLSQILEDDRGLHIVRVVERKEASRASFVDCQDGIKKKIKDERGDKQMKAYMATLEAKTPVWTIFDDPEKDLSAPNAATAASPNGADGLRR